MDNDLYWAKTILTVYKHLERLSDAFDKIILKSGLASGNVVGQNLFYNNVGSVTQRIIDLSQRKITLINLKILTEKALLGLKKKDAEILLERYVDGRKCREIADESQVDIRTVFRKINSAEASFVKNLHMLGYDGKSLAKMLEEEGWIKNVYEEYAEKNIKDVCLSNSFLKNAVSL